LTSRNPAAGVPAGQKNRARRARPPRVYLHVGEPKTGTTFLQHALWANRARIAAQGVLLPGYTRRDHSRASRDLRGTPRQPSDPSDPWAGEWDVLVREALHAREAAVISDELLAVCNAPQADRAARSLAAAELHLILTVRDIASLLPAEWQESIKTRRSVPWEQWLADVIAAEPAADRRRQSWFWTAHDTLATLGLWSQHLPPDRVHVITMPRQTSPGDLWTGFASVLGIDAGSADLSQARVNSSLGLAQIEFLRRMNLALPGEIPDWYYTRYLKQLLPHDVLSAQPAAERLTLPPGREAWAREQADILVAGLRDSGYHIVGELCDLLPRPAAGGLYAAPDEQPAERLLEVAMRVTAVLADSRYRELYRPPPRPARVSLRQLASRLSWSLLYGRRLRRVLRRASHRPAVQRLRVAIWWLLMRPTRHRRAVETGEYRTYRSAAAEAE
jgi:hypothetical protein